MSTDPSLQQPDDAPRDLDQYDPETEVRDDAIIGTAIKWSLVVFLGVGAIVAAAILLRPAPEEPTVVIDETPATIEGYERTGIEPPTIRFTDVTDAAGIDFVHENGAIGEKLLPETMGGGVAFLDHDGDGDQDLLLISSDRWPNDPDYAVRPITTRLYRNDGTGRFEDVTTAAGLDHRLYGMGCAVGDYDGDGRVDLFITGLGGNRLLRNLGGRFEDVTERAGVAGSPTDWNTSAGFFDADGDGDLDLFHCRYVEWSRSIDFELGFTLNGRDRAYGPPTNYRGTQPVLYRNDGDGTFTDVSEAAGLHVFNAATGVPVGKGLAVAIADVDHDGDLDVIVANDTTQNFLFVNAGDGTFTEAGTTSGLAFDSNGRATGAMGIDVAQPLADESLAVAIGNFARESTSFYVSTGSSLRFNDVATAEGIGSPSRIKLTFGLFFFDPDLDGWPDLLQANGHLEEEINEIEPSQHYQQPAQLFWNCGPNDDACYVVMPDEAVGDLARPIVGRGAAYADIDGDGDQDVILTQTGGRPMLLRNDQDAGHHWIRVRLVGQPPNTSAIGALVSVRAGDRVRTQRVMPTRSYLSQVELPVTFGLGELESVDEIVVHWPNGSTQTLPDPAIDRVHVIEQHG